MTSSQPFLQIKWCFWKPEKVMQSFRPLSMWVDTCKQCPMHSLLDAFFDFVVITVWFVIEMDLPIWKNKKHYMDAYIIHSAFFFREFKEDSWLWCYCSLCHNHQMELVPNKADGAFNQQTIYFWYLWLICHQHNF